MPIAVVGQDGKLKTSDTLVIQQNEAEQSTAGSTYLRYVSRYDSPIAPSGSVAVGVFSLPQNRMIYGRLSLSIRQQPEASATQGGRVMVFYFYCDSLSGSLANLTLSSSEYSQGTNSQPAPTVTLTSSGNDMYVNVQNNASTKNIEAVGVLVEITVG
ncbi:MAG: hypothetical protein KatS3mg087_1828 [Patescibacteria group bacterium]|nr:MAG: hypothetical protein KatS3mg087_1828 [Patescibacteria group bacterium]